MKRRIETWVRGIIRDAVTEALAERDRGRELVMNYGDVTTTYRARESRRNMRGLA